MTLVHQRLALVEEAVRFRSRGSRREVVPAGVPAGRDARVGVAFEEGQRAAPGVRLGVDSRVEEQTVRRQVVRPELVDGVSARVEVRVVHVEGGHQPLEPRQLLRQRSEHQVREPLQQVLVPVHVVGALLVVDEAGPQHHPVLADATQLARREALRLDEAREAKIVELCSLDGSVIGFLHRFGSDRENTAVEGPRKCLEYCHGT